MADQNRRRLARTISVGDDRARGEHRRFDPQPVASARALRLALRRRATRILVVMMEDIDEESEFVGRDRELPDRVTLTDRIEQAIAWERTDERIAADLGVDIARVAKVRAQMDADAADDSAVDGRRGRIAAAAPTSDRVTAIVADLRSGLSQSETARRHGVGPATVKRAARRWCPDLTFKRGRPRATAPSP